MNQSVGRNRADLFFTRFNLVKRWREVSLRAILERPCKQFPPCNLLSGLPIPGVEAGIVVHPDVVHAPSCSGSGEIEPGPRQATDPFVGIISKELPDRVRV